MKKSSILFSVLLISCADCNDNPTIFKECLLNYPCYVVGNETITKDFPVFSGECALGTITSCDKENNFICEGLVLPAEEVCDSLDNDCDGIIDEGYDNDQDGFTICAGDCDDTNPDIFPTKEEYCDNIDNNCNGQKDENIFLECYERNNPDIVFGETSICAKGKRICESGVWKSCSGAVYPRPENCDGFDNDCDGEIDEPELNACGPQPVGVCSKGTQICLNDEVSCVDAVWPSGEVCDGLDNDCNSFIDENIYRPCETLCGTGLEECRRGSWIDCSAQAPSTEICDGLDNDCDGETDEDCECSDGAVRVCLDGLICGLGVQFCFAGEWNECVFYGTGEESCNNWDDNCDGSIDGLTAPCGAPENTGLGLCVIGTSSCSAGVWSECAGEISPATEVCDGEDNDCDGETDESLNPREKVDLMFAIDVSGSMCGAITALANAMGAYVSLFQGTEHRFGLSIFPSISNRSMPLEVITNPPLTDVNTFISALSALNCDGGGVEPSYDTMLILTNVSSNTSIGWRNDAYPYIVLVSDESAQTWVATTENDVAAQTDNCFIGGCTPPNDQVEFYVITNGSYFSMWDAPTYFESNRLIELTPVDENRYVNVLRGILDDLCVLSP